MRRRWGDERGIDVRAEKTRLDELDFERRLSISCLSGRVVNWGRKMATRFTTKANICPATGKPREDKLSGRGKLSSERIRLVYSARPATTPTTGIPTKDKRPTASADPLATNKPRTEPGSCAPHLDRSSVGKIMHPSGAHTPHPAHWHWRPASYPPEPH